MIQDIVAQLKDKKGYTQYPQDKYHPWDYVTLLQKRVTTTARCELNPYVCMNIYVNHRQDSVSRFNVGIGVFHNEVYYKCTCGLDADDVVEKIDKTEKLLIKMIELI